MFRVKTRRNSKRATSPQPTLPVSPIVGTATATATHAASATADLSGVPTVDLSGSSFGSAKPNQNELKGSAPISTPVTLMSRLTNFFEAESAAASTTKPWLRLERGLRLQKLRTYADTYPDLTFEERDSLNKALVKANDSKLLNTKQQIVYEGGKILNIRGLKIIRSNDPTHIASFKIEIHRQTKKKGSE